MNLAIIGPPGCGKRTQSEMLATAFHLPRGSCGNLFRQQLMDRTALGILARKYMERGELVPDEVVDAMLEEWVLRQGDQKGLVLDGFPRTEYQADFLASLLARNDRSIAAVFYLDISDASVTERMASRVVCRRCQTSYNLRSRPPRVDTQCDVCGESLVQREDDHPALIKARLRTFHRTVRPVIEYYQERGKLVVIDAERDVAEIRRDIAGAVKAIEDGLGVPAASDETVRALLARVTTPPPAAAPPALRVRLDIVLLGAPGSGKGTQAETICDELELPHIATGDLFRDNLKRKTELGKIARTYMDRGELVPDEVTDAMVKDRLGRDDTADGFVLDGYPRNLHQAQALSDMEEALDRGVRGVLYIKVSDEEIVSRLSGRLICRDCQAPYHLRFKPPAQEGVCDSCGGELYQRDDDNPETVRARLRIFHAQTKPLIAYYRKAGLLFEVEGEGELPAVAGRCLEVVRGLRDAALPA